MLALPSAAASAAGPTTGPAATSATASTVPGAETDVAGEWQVAAESVAGYRVREQLANLSAESDAVGRTSDVTGSITVEENGVGVRLTAGALTVRHDEHQVRRGPAR